MITTATGPAGILERVNALVPTMLERDNWSRDEVLAYQRERLRELIRHAVARSSYYRRVFGPDAADGDLPLDELPTLPKATLMEHFDEIAADPGLRLSTIDRDHYRVFSTSGTTGLRGVVVMAPDEWETWIAVHMRVFRHAGIEPGMRLAPIGAPSPHHLSRQLFGVFRAGPHGAPDLSVTSPMTEIVDALNEYQPEALLGYPSIQGALAEEQLTGRLRISPRAAACGAEPITEDVRRRMDAAWGIRPVNIYPTTEVPVIASGSLDSPTLEILEDLVIVEPVDEQNRPVGPGEPSAKVLVTNLVNRAQPLIRYELSDSVTPAGGPNPAGRPWARLCRIEGRIADTIELPSRDGGTVMVHPVRIGQAVAAVPDVRQYQVIHDESGITARVVAREAAPPDTCERVRSALLAEFEDVGAIPPPVRVQEFDELEREPGPAAKFRIVKSSMAARRVG